MIQKSDRIKTVINKKRGFTLVEILIVMAILVMMSTILVGILNSIGITNKGRDAQRKKNLNRIKIAFEEYFNDKGYFPPDYESWNIKSNCGKNIPQFPSLNPWPCDPNGQPYKIYVETNKFRIITNLENKKDKDIPVDWYIKNDFNMPILGLNTKNANYGVSSSNILWYEEFVRDYSDLCYIDTCFKLSHDITHTSDSCINEDCAYQVNSGTEQDCKVSVCYGRFYVH